MNDISNLYKEIEAKTGICKADITSESREAPLLACRYYIVNHLLKEECSVSFIASVINRTRSTVQNYIKNMDSYKRHKDYKLMKKLMSKEIKKDKSVSIFAWLNIFKK